MAEVIISNIDLWTSALLNKSSVGSNGNQEAYGIKKLRELILDLALRGKIVLQDPNDDPASVLLERIQKAKARLITEGKAKQEKPLPEIAESDKPYSLPTSWSWARLPDTASYKVGKTPSTKNPDFWSEGEAGVPWVSISDMDHMGVLTTTSKRITKYAAERVFGHEPIAKGSLLMSFKLTVGKTAILGVDAYHNEAIISLQPYSGITRDYLFKALPFRAQEGDTKRAIMGHTLNSTSLSLLLIPVPPLAEQRRIVAKVDELMALCDQLEQEQTHSIEVHQALVETLLGTLTRAPSPQDLTEAWNRIANNFDVLFTTEYSIDQLKQTILQLAVIGKLVPQDPNDEPASVLLSTITVGKARLVKEGVIRGEKVLIHFQGLDELKRTLPSSWEWARLNDIADIVRGGSPRPAGDPRFYDGEIPFLKVADVSRASGKLVDGFTYTIKEAGLRKTRFINERTVLLTNSGATLGIPAICDFPATFNDGIAAFVQLSSGVFDEYLYLYLKSLSQWFLEFASRGQGQPNLNTDIIKATWFALPPFREQHRIVAKVDELMALCDALKVRLADAQTTQVHLAHAIVEQAVA